MGGGLRLLKDATAPGSSSFTSTRHESASFAPQGSLPRCLMIVAEGVAKSGEPWALAAENRLMTVSDRP
jgi:hypothetical protein